MSKTQAVILQTLVITLVLSVSGSVAPAAAENQAGLPAEARAHADLSPQIWLPIQPQRM
ncbi:MAG: hypothetical protein GTN93_07665, partial [Anaerolineae bacterium]|nr:hypothetical protein [Anaerolineae bacterium]